MTSLAIYIRRLCVAAALATVALDVSARATVVARRPNLFCDFTRKRRLSISLRDM